jgi:hypothetical protein
MSEFSSMRSFLGLLPASNQRKLKRLSGCGIDVPPGFFLGNEHIKLPVISFEIMHGSKSVIHSCRKLRVDNAIKIRNFVEPPQYEIHD